MNDISKLISGGVPARIKSREPVRKRDTEKVEDADLYRRRRAPLNRIPTADELAHLINNALTALARGIYWDRGSIVNIVL